MTAPALVFDLDDTLYKERDYVRSCFVWVSAHLAAAHGYAGEPERLSRDFANGARDPVGALCREIGLAEDAVARVIAGMRSHAPAIALSPDAALLIAHLRAHAAPFSIVTDGRSVTQRRKLEALGLDDALSVSISGETGWTKPDTRCFAAAVAAHGAERLVYVADNPAKDFLGPNRLGWTTVMLADDGRNIHAQDREVGPEFRPTRTIRSLTELIDG